MPTLTPEVARRRARDLACARIALGVVALAAPSAPARPWVGDAAASPSSRTLARGLGARDVALGLGALLALRHGTPVRGWLEAGGLADAGDVAATLVGFADRPRAGRWLVLAAAAGGVAVSRALAPLVD